jgi:rare lipoprotein A (peptidoglycan hydrolase)
VKVPNLFVRSKAALAAKSLVALVVTASVVLGGSAAQASTMAGSGGSVTPVATAAIAAATATATSAVASTATIGSAEPSATSAPKPVVKPHPRPRPKKIVWKSAFSSCYGSADLGTGLAGGGRLRSGMMIVANKTLPFGTKIEFMYHGKRGIAIVKDRGPYVGGRVFDLAQGIAQRIGFLSAGIGTVKYRILALGKSRH